ncbi:transposase [Rhodovulum sulfidophilum]|nr:transposase [Rhodovulum sulfidophilum]
MKRKRFSEEKIIGVLKEHEAEAKVDDICRRHGISSATFYNEPLLRHWSEHNGECARSTAVWMRPKPSGCASSKPRTPSSSGSWQIRCKT